MKDDGWRRGVWRVGCGVDFEGVDVMFWVCEFDTLTASDEW